MTQTSVYRQTVTVTLENGLHLVPCSRISQFAQKHQCDIRICKDELKVDAKNIFDLMTLCAEKGTVLVLEARGDGASEAVRGLVSLFENDFDMDEAD